MLLNIYSYDPTDGQKYSHMVEMLNQSQRIDKLPDLPHAVVFE